MTTDDLPQRLAAAASAALLDDDSDHGPPAVRAFLNHDVVTLVVKKTLTPTERVMAKVDEAALEAKYRAYYDYVVESRLTPLVEKESRQVVVGVLSDHSPSPDVGVFNFLLAEPPAS